MHNGDLTNYYNNFHQDRLDNEGRLLKPQNEIINYDFYPERVEEFISNFNHSFHYASSKDWPMSSRLIWPELDWIVHLNKLDVFETREPYSQLATSNKEESQIIREMPGWNPLRSILFLDKPAYFTTELTIERSLALPLRAKYRMGKKANSADVSKWNFRELIHVFQETGRTAGSTTFSIDYTDLPDRYFLNSSIEPDLGHRRFSKFNGYSVTQYYVLQKTIFHKDLDAEGGTGSTYILESGPILYPRKNWKLLTSFYGFDHQLNGTNQFTIYSKLDPFPHMQISMEKINHPESWIVQGKFYAFDTPVPGTVMFQLQHTVRSIKSTTSSVQRHRITNEDPRNPWEFRGNFYVFAADLADCTFSIEDQPVNSLFSNSMSMAYDLATEVSTFHSHLPAHSFDLNQIGSNSIISYHTQPQNNTSYNALSSNRMKKAVGISSSTDIL